MRIYTNISIAAVIIILLVIGVFGQVKGDDSLDKIVGQFIPKNSELAHKAVKGAFGDASAETGPANIVVLYKKATEPMEYDGLVLSPNGGDSYDAHLLPKPENTWSMMGPVAVFFANGDGDTANELFIIDECYTGIGPEGARAFYRTRVYDWNGIEFKHLDSLSEEIGNLRTAAAVKAKVKKLAKILSDKKTEMQVAVDVKDHNEQIKKAAEAGEEWVKDPARIIARTFGSFLEVRTKSIEFNAPTADQPDSLFVTVIGDGYLDDSVRGEKFRLELKSNEQGVWKFTSASKSWRCQAGRGSQEFSNSKCL